MPFGGSAASDIDAGGIGEVPQDTLVHAMGDSVVKSDVIRKVGSAVDPVGLSVLGEAVGVSVQIEAATRKKEAEAKQRQV